MFRHTIAKKQKTLRFQPQFHNFGGLKM